MAGLVCARCLGDFAVRADHKGKLPKYCSDECRMMVRAEAERERRKDLCEHGLCPRCKRPRVTD